MLDTQQIFLIAALVCLLTSLVLYAVSFHGVAGIRHILLAMVIGILANTLYAFGRELPPVLAYEVANGSYAAAWGALLLGYRRLFYCAPSGRLVVGGVIALTMLIALFHYVFDSFFLRSLVVSLFQISIACAIAMTLLRSPKPWPKPYYSKLLILFVCTTVALGHIARLLMLVLTDSPPTSLLQSNLWNLMFLTALSVALPSMALGGLLLAHRRILANAEHAANRDFLTNAWSRRAFFQTGERELALASRLAYPVSLLLIDLDNFKPINDAYGHKAGDNVLICFVERASSALREVDLLARLGGDEFAVLMPGTSEGDAAGVADRLKRCIDAPDDRRETPMIITLSMGVAAAEVDDTLQSLLARADIALYDAKNRGRNRIVRHSECAARDIAFSMQNRRA